MKINQKGFGLIEGLLAIVFIGIIGAIGWYVWQSNRTSEPEESKQAVQVIEYTDSAKIYSFSYPENWVTKPYEWVVVVASRSLTGA